MNKADVSKEIIIFEDEKDFFLKIKDELNTDALILDGIDLIQEGRYSEKVEGLDKYFRGGNIELVILDQELSLYEEKHVSAADIAELCNLSGIPILVYSNQDFDKILRLKNWGERRILLSNQEELDTIGEYATNLYDGFKMLREKYSEFRGGGDKNPFDILFDVMNAPESSHTQIKLYATGYFDVMPENDEIEEEIKKHFPTLLGYWIYNSLFRFPGVLLNEVAAASYLGIDEKEYSKNDNIQSLFSIALYTGPLGKLRNYWWKDKLDVLLAEAEIEGKNPGLLYLKENNITDVNPVKCSVGHEGAGYYCIISGKPVCQEHSTGNISWLPSGASHSMISHQMLDKLGPWYQL